MGEQVRAGNVEFWVERRGQGPEVLIISGLADPVEAWQFQLDGCQTATGSPPTTTAGWDAPHG